ncbi:Gfo/Idh/MocA family oxidoreductase [Siccirubricoccus sp. KC 17139]|uniref:Gfo/Idh/MocA family oxidoreductase n=1 Tax=Siccirubricoccus soli TaxID=2899147 RepID=A0ABT1D434_9PROT|nr:Gfo/Idh/MocA family oxidoreductase [Siccirubricoccus soli]MCO6416688.1 Gfo/Idh/MocA family oxidoreductase [Siccirubricoccus soli]MCP2682823.1 Gfo/Idh/MocA family oxidoreductase [Siccirubricoccus soli]
MNLHRMLAARAAAGRPVTVGVIGAGKFGSMFLAMAARSPGLHVAGIADLALPRAREALARIGWPAERYGAASLDAAFAGRSTFLTEDSAALILDPRIEVVVECTGHPAAGIRHALACIAAGKHIVMVNVEADVLAGPLLAEKARAAGVVYSMAYGDQPALVCEMVDTLRAEGFTVVAAGKGTKYLPEYHASTPATVWGHYGLTEEQARLGGMNPQMFNSFLDGTKSAIEMAAIANATGLAPPEDGLAFPPCGVQDLPRVFAGSSGRVEVISSLERDGRPVAGDLRWGVYAVFEGETEYVRRCFAEYGVATDPSGRYAALWRPYHFIGLELGISVASAALRKEPTGCAEAWRGDVAATAKRDLAPGEVLDGEGGAMVWGKCIPAARSLALGALPIGLAHGVTLTRAVKAGAILSYADVALDETAEAVRLRRAMEAAAAMPAKAAE